MDIIFQGLHNTEEASQSIADVLQLFRERYQVGQFKEMRLTVTMVDDQGENLELIDSETGYVYRIFEVYREEHELLGRKGKPLLQLVVNNTRR